MTAVGRRRNLFERRHGRASARLAALHPSSLQEIESLARLCYGRDTTLAQLLGLNAVADETVGPASWRSEAGHVHSAT